ncbi:hypothetical protein [Azospirillum sp. B506]|uniref:hypothetical protein n=1 Tax=Azospirillum sp. B506 TaxID=137721 RepID=UPI00034B5656|nr:hypothetical protein [Azospirillum sp. B506]
MLAYCRRLQERWGLALALALALSLFVRIAAPAAGAADRDGYVAICTGGEIVYLPVDRDGVPLQDSVPLTDTDGIDKQQLSPLHLPCSWLGQYVALLPALQMPALPVAILLSAESPKPDRLNRSKERKPFQSQGPPSDRPTKH